MTHSPRKRFGQNFLIDQGIVNAIIEAIAPQSDEVIVEIGPGLGALTQPLSRCLKKLHVIEIDRDLVEKLRVEYSPEKLIIYSEDALNFNFGTLPAKFRVVGNLPYNISTPLLFHLMQFADSIKDMHFMLQKEVVERMVAQPSTPEYGRLSVMLQYRFHLEKLFDVSQHAFHPVPAVESAIVRMTPRTVDELTAKDSSRYAEIVKAGFGQRRKTLRNTLKAYLAEEDFIKLDIDSRLRAENLSVNQFVAITNYLKS